jgi:hydrogenase small subunit
LAREQTIAERMREGGLSRRDFLKMCAMLAATIGLHYSEADKVVRAMEKKRRVPVLWLQMQDCTGCSESFIRSSHPKAGSVLLDMISLEYSELLSAASGHQAEMARKRVMKEHDGEYLLVVEGSIPRQEYCATIGGVSAKELLLESARGAKAIIAYGTCSSWGGIAGAKPNPTEAVSVADLVTDKPVIRVPGCPPIGEVMTGVIAHMITFDRLPELDHLGRPKAFYRHRIHDKCNRRAYFDAGLFAESFDDEGAKQGYCLYKLGCKGPTTYNSCAEMRWNGGVGFPILSGNPCIGCSEKNFWDNGPLFVRRAKIPATQTTADLDKIGLYTVGATVAGIAAHAAITAVKKKRTGSSADGGDSHE